MDAETGCLAIVFIGGLHDAMIQANNFDTSFTAMNVDRAFDISAAVVF